MAEKTDLERAQIALKKTLKDQIASRFASFMGWIADGEAAKKFGVADPDAAFERSMRELRDGHARAREIIDKVFKGPQ